MKSLIIAFKFFLFFTIITGIIYPIIVTGFAQLVFPKKASGSLIIKDNKIIGSLLIGQQFDTTIYFTSRPSAFSYNSLLSGGSNYGLTNIKLKGLVTERKKQFIVFNQLDSLADIPSEMLFASASGLDPHISIEAALMQTNRIAKARNFNDLQKKQLITMVHSLVENAQFGIFGERRLNVLRLNLKTDLLFVK